MKTLLITALAVAGFANLLRAATIVQGPVTAGPTALDFSQNITFNKFDPSSGTLLDIQFVVSATTNNMETVSNTGGSSRLFTIISSVDAILSGSLLVFDETIPVSTHTVNLNVRESASFSDSATGQATAIFDGTTGARIFYNGSGSVSSNIPPGDFIGAGQTYTFNFSALNNSAVIGGSNNSTTSAIGNGLIQIIYDFTPTEVPEPAALVLFGSALLGIGFVRVQKRD